MRELNEVIEIFKKVMAPRVANGAALLDKIKPEWTTCITKPLQMMSGKQCVAGQVFDQEGKTERLLGYRYFFYSYLKNNHTAFCNGFLLSYNIMELTLNELEYVIELNVALAELWEDEIAQRRAQAV